MTDATQRRNSTLQAIRTGSWVTANRVRVYAAICGVITFLAIRFILVTATGLSDMNHNPIGTDYSNMYVAGSLAREGQAEKTYVVKTQYARSKQIFGPKAPAYGWSYPPFFMLLHGMLAALPYFVALAIWQGAGLAVYLRSLWVTLPYRAVLLPAIAFPGVLVNLTHGQTGFLTTALLLSGLLCLRPRPVLAGICFGLLAYKPQLGVLIPLALMMGGHWRSFVSAAAMVIALSAAATMVYGVAIWEAFFASMEFLQSATLQHNGAGFFKMQSVFAQVRLVGGSVHAAYVAQGALSVLLAYTISRLWRARQVAMEIQSSALILACLLATPYSFDYDLVALAAVIALLVRHGLREGFAPYERTMLALVWTVPLYGRAIAGETHVVLGLWMMLVLYAILWQRVRCSLNGRTDYRIVAP